MAVVFLFLSSIVSASYFIDINIPEYKLRLYKDGVLVSTYPIAVGKSITPSILGDFKIATIVKNPTWYPQGKDPVPPGPDNPLGPWWLGLDYPGYGIHGNNAPDSIGKAQSKGCIRMRNADVEYLASKVQKGTPVRLRYEPLIASFEGDIFKVAVYEDLYDLGINTPSNLRSLSRYYNQTIDAPNWVLEEFLKWHNKTASPLPKTKDIIINKQLVGYGYEILGDVAIPLASLRNAGLQVGVDGKGAFLIDGTKVLPIVGDEVSFTYLSVLEKNFLLDVKRDGAISVDVYQSYLDDLLIGRVLSFNDDYLFNVTLIANHLGSSLYINPGQNAAMIDGQLILNPKFYNNELYLNEDEIADYLALGVLWDRDSYHTYIGKTPVYINGERSSEDGYIYNSIPYVSLKILEEFGVFPDWIDRITERVMIKDRVIQANKVGGNKFYLLVDDFIELVGSFSFYDLDSAGIYLSVEPTLPINESD